MKLKLETKYTENFIKKHEYDQLRPFVELSNQILENKSGAGNDFLGWVDLPKNYDKEEFVRIQKAAEKIKNDSEILIVIGIGGSYLGAKAAIEFLSNTFYNNQDKSVRKGPQIFFAGTNMSPVYLKHLLDLVGDKDFSINVISKSGTTTEPAIAFRVFKEKLEKKYGKKEAATRIYATTETAKGALTNLSTSDGYETFVVPDNVGGRFSVLTAVGLLPIAVAGINIQELMNGAAAAMEDYSNENFYENDAMIYAATRHILYNKGKNIEILTNYEPRLHFIAEWWKQLFAESEGKDGKGIYPTSADFSTDLHSIGQSIQEARRTMFETVLLIDKPEEDILINKEEVDLDGLNYISGKTLDYVNKQAAKGVILAHVTGDVPNLVITIPEATPFNLGYLFYFFEKAVAIGGYMLGINPFDQPGVEEYKKNMFALLEKPGYESETKKLKELLGE